jgi:hypothetical protein
VPQHPYLFANPTPEKWCPILQIRRLQNRRASIPFCIFDARGGRRIPQLKTDLMLLVCNLKMRQLKNFFPDKIVMFCTIIGGASPTKGRCKGTPAFTSR